MAELVDIEGTELDALDSLVVSDGWKLVVARIQSEIERTRDALESNAMPEAETAFRRGTIAILRVVLELPKILRTEFIQKGER